LLEDLLGIILKSLCLKRDELGIEFGHSDVLRCLSVDSLTGLSCDCSESAETRAGVGLYLNTIAGGSLTEESLHSLVVGSFMEALNELA
jgi:hypothetical protein